MSISINPIFPVIAAQGAAPDAALQPGTVIDAQVQKILANDLVRIAIANLTIEVLSEIPLEVGQTLQLAVSQTAQGLKLSVVGQSASANQAAARRARRNGPADTVTLTPDVAAAVTAARADAVVASSAKSALTRWKPFPYRPRRRPPRHGKAACHRSTPICWWLPDRASCRRRCNRSWTGCWLHVPISVRT